MSSTVPSQPAPHSSSSSSSSSSHRSHPALPNPPLSDPEQPRPSFSQHQPPSRSTPSPPTSRAPALAPPPPTLAPTRPPPPKCVAECIRGLQSCTRSVNHLNQRIQQSTSPMPLHHPERPPPPPRADPVYVSKAIIPLVLAILSWVYVVYVWRLCYPTLNSFSSSSPSSSPPLASRATGITLLVLFNLLWIMTIWSYLRVIISNPGHAKDYIPTSAPPRPCPPDNPTLYPAFGRQHPTSEGYRGPQYEAAHQWDPYHDVDETIAGPPYSTRQRSDSMVATRSVRSVYMTDGDEVEGGGARQGSGYAGGGQPKSCDSNDSNYTACTAAERQADHAVTLIGNKAGKLQEEEEGEGEGRAGEEVDGAEEEAEEREEEEGHTKTKMYKPSLEIHRNHHPPCSEPHPGQERQQDHHGFRFPDPQPHQRPYDPNPRPTRRRSVERPLDPTNMYCHQCQRLKPPRSHHCRRCGTCVLKMDHHCPWVGGCVGANNQRYFYIFVLWVTLLEIFTMVSTAVLFDRGVRWNRHAGRAGESVAGDGDGKASWKLDGYLISLFPITAIFTLFTGALLITHTYLLTHNLTTLEHMGINRVKAREEILIQNYLKRQESAARSRATIPNDGGRRWWKKQNWHIREIKEMRKGLDKDFGSLDKEANLWWIGGRREVQIADLVGFTDHKLRDLETGQNDEQGIPPFPNVILVDQSQTRQAKGREEGEDEKRAQDRTPTEIGVDPDRGSVKTRSKETKPTTSTADAAAAALVNFTQVMGDSPLLWFLPLPLPGDGTPSGKGLSFPVNPRFGPAGVLRSRDQWPPSL